MSRSLQSDGCVQYRLDTSVHYGSVEHYFHFAMGYLFPMIAAACRDPADIRTMIVEDCGPLMRPLFSQLQQLLGRRVVITESKTADSSMHEIVLPRWDFLCRRNHLLSPPPNARQEFLDHVDDLNLCQPALMSALAKSDFQTNLHNDFTAFRELAWTLVDPSPSPFAGKVLVLERETEVPHLTRPEQGREGRYGKGRRSIKNVPDVVADLRKLKCPAADFVCGGHSLEEQIRAFRDCRGLIMIRGAEVANFLFLRPGTPVYMVCTKEFTRSPAPHDGIAPAMKIPMCLSLVEDSYSNIDAAEALDALQNLRVSDFERT